MRDGKKRNRTDVRQVGGGCLDGGEEPYIVLTVKGRPEQQQQTSSVKSKCEFNQFTAFLVPPRSVVLFFLLLYYLLGPVATTLKVYGTSPVSDCLQLGLDNTSSSHRPVGLPCLSPSYFYLEEEAFETRELELLARTGGSKKLCRASPCQ